MLCAIRHMLARFGKASDGVAAVEFAMVLPLLLVLYMGSIEASQLITADRRVTTVAGTLGDLVSRSKDTIAASTLDNYFGAAASTMSPMPTATLVQVVSLVSVDASGTARVKWSKPFPASATARAVNSTYDLSGAPEMRDLAKGRDMVIAEATYTYHPLLNLVFKADVPLSRTNFYLPRFAGTIACC